MLTEKQVKLLEELKPSFPNLFVNSLDEVIVNKLYNIYFCFSKCSTKQDIIVKLLHWVSRSCIRGVSLRVMLEMRNGINNYLGTDFCEDDFNLIYDNIGNGINEQKTLAFIQSNYNPSALVAKLKEGGITNA